MPDDKVGNFVGPLSSTWINRILQGSNPRDAQALEFTEIPIGGLRQYSPEFDSDYPPEAVALKQVIASADAVLFVTPETTGPFRVH